MFCSIQTKFDLLTLLKRWVRSERVTESVFWGQICVFWTFWASPEKFHRITAPPQHPGKCSAHGRSRLTSWLLLEDELGPKKWENRRFGRLHVFGTPSDQCFGVRCVLLGVPRVISPWMITPRVITAPPQHAGKCSTHGRPSVTSWLLLKDESGPKECQNWRFGTFQRDITVKYYP